MVFNGVLFPIATPRITLPFRATETKWYSEEKPHRGVDIAPFPGSHGELVRMPLHGRVIDVGFHEYAGNQVITEHEAPFEFWAAGLDDVTTQVERGERIYFRSTHHHEVRVSIDAHREAGEVIATIGNTGRYTTGPHVHLELHVGAYPGRVLNPIHFFIAAIPGLRDVITNPW